MNSKLRAAMISLVVATAVPAAAQTVVEGTFPPGLQLTLKQMNDVVSKAFYDPASTRYRGLVVEDRLVMDLVICGWLSSKNSRGVYTAYYPFAYGVKDGSVYIGMNYHNPSSGQRTMAALADFGCAKEALGL